MSAKECFKRRYSIEVVWKPIKAAEYGVEACKRSYYMQGWRLRAALAIDREEVEEEELSPREVLQLCSYPVAIFGDMQ